MKGERVCLVLLGLVVVTGALAGGVSASGHDFVINNSSTEDVWTVDEEITVDYNITNSGSAQATETVELKLDGSVVAFEDLNLSAGETATGSIGFEPDLSDVGDNKELNLTVGDDFETHSVRILAPILTDTQPKSGSYVAPVTLETTVENINSQTTIEFRDGNGDVIDSVVVDSSQDVNTTWNVGEGVRNWSVHALNQSGYELDSAGPYQIEIVPPEDVDANRDAVCGSFREEMEDLDLVCAFVGPYVGAMPLVVLGFLVYTPIALSLFIRTGSPIIPYILLLLTGGVVSAQVAAPGIAVLTVVALAILGAVPVIAYRHFRRY